MHGRWAKRGCPLNLLILFFSSASELRGLAVGHSLMPLNYLPRLRRTICHQTSLFVENNLQLRRIRFCNVLPVCFSSADYKCVHTVAVIGLYWELQEVASSCWVYLKYFKKNMFNTLRSIFTVTKYFSEIPVPCCVYISDIHISAYITNMPALY